MNNKPLYFIAIIPPEPLRSHISEIKTAFSTKFHSFHALKSPPHITLIPPFRINIFEEKPIVKKLEAFAKTVSVFWLKIEGIGSFRSSVIFLNVLENEYLQVCQKNISTQLNGFSGIHISTERPFHPHITLANRDLSPQMFRKAWELNKSIPYKYEFEVKYIFLLKHNGKFWDIYCEFQLPPTPLPA